MIKHYNGQQLEESKEATFFLVQIQCSKSNFPRFRIINSIHLFNECMIGFLKNFSRIRSPCPPSTVTAYAFFFAQNSELIVLP